MDADGPREPFRISPEPFGPIKRNNDHSQSQEVSSVPPTLPSTTTTSCRAMSSYYHDRAHPYYNHPFSYSMRRQGTLSRMGSRLWQSLFLSSDPADDLHDKALTALPPLRKRSATDSTTAASTLGFWAVTEDVVVMLALTVATGLLTRAVVMGVWSVWPKGDDEDQESSPKQD